MILRLRQRHRRMVIALGVFLPVAFAVGIAARKPVPSMQTLPAGFVVPEQKFAAVEWVNRGLFEHMPIYVELRRERTDAGQFAVRFSADKNFMKPDLLVYWIGGDSKVADKLPEDALLVGAFESSAPLPLPASVASGNGVLLLYSLADQQVVATSKPFTMEKP
jgi:hypothetical protein